MKKDPYKVMYLVGNESLEEIQEIYLELLEEYTEQIEDSDPFVSEAGKELVQELNQAYQSILKNKREPQLSNKNTDELISGATELIKNGDYEKADLFLLHVDDSEKNAQWYFLKGSVYVQRGWYTEALKSFEQAQTLEPNNPAYQKAIDGLKQNANDYIKGYCVPPSEKSKRNCCTAENGACFLCCECFGECFCEALGDCS